MNQSTRIPCVVLSTKAMVFDTHTHTLFCRHAALYMPRAVVAAANARGLKGVAMCCHCPMPEQYDYKHRMTMEEWPSFVDVVARERELCAQMYPDITTTFNLEPEEQARLRALDVDGCVEAYFSQVGEAASSGLFNVMAHLDFIRFRMISIGHRDFTLTPEDAHFRHVLTCLDAIKAAGVAVEINTSSVAKGFKDHFPSEPIIRAAVERGIPLVLSSDAHRPEHVGRGFLTALKTLEACGASHVSHFIGGQRYETPLGDALAAVSSHASDRAVEQVIEEARPMLWAGVEGGDVLDAVAAVSARAGQR
ncbi:histidinol phosphate phosphatase, HisJ [Kipferlia bialata]|uniref:Histidinol phosphate phosphatase, HisJ n=1 Tax=Kipferlia bialata TaxID=797122 RepID=A0A9K3CSA5_9EUKA|nr:histidinol phosphate phosphatase, HisJ [Kipferlia bialata]|eukprot:g2784.t1